MELFDGRKSAEKIEDQLRTTLQELGSIVNKELLIVQVGDNEASTKYVELKLKLATKLGIKTKYLHLSAEKTVEEVKSQVLTSFISTNTGGGIVQLPLPNEEFQSLLELIPRHKDIDLLSPKSQEIFYSGNFERLPPVIRSTKYFVDSIGLDMKGLKIIIVGEGFLVGKPLAFYFKSKGADVVVETDYHKGKYLDCQLLILSAGIPNLVAAADIKNGCHVIDFGSSVVDGRTVGDLDMSGNFEHLGFVSPSPGGMGPLVVRFLMLNFIDAVLAE
jgi:methylenetetrahydrofolate dehydrogenase (NADP+)/methenyltetrahydrofolate cyclohydrolase